MINKIAEFSDYVGSEIVLAAPMDANGRLGMPVILAELKKPGFGAIRSGRNEQGRPRRRRSAHHRRSRAGHRRAGCLDLARKDLLAVSRMRSALRLGDGEFAKTPFGARMANAYRNGIGILFSADLERIAKHASGGSPRESAAFAA